MKSDSTTATLQLIERIRATFPFNLPDVQICDGECRGWQSCRN